MPVPSSTAIQNFDIWPLKKKQKKNREKFGSAYPTTFEQDTKIKEKRRKKKLKVEWKKKEPNSMANW